MKLNVALAVIVISDIWALDMQTPSEIQENVSNEVAAGFSHHRWKKTILR